MRHFFPRLVQQLLLLPVVLFVGTVGPTVARAAQLTLTWTDTSMNEDVFKIERKAGTTGTFAQVATVGANVTSYLDIDPTLTGGATYCYQVRAYNTAGNSAYSNTACGIAPADTQFPTVSLSAPVSGATVSGSSVTVSALASDNVGVIGIQFLLDGANLGSEDTVAPYSTTWNTTTVPNGTHNLATVARDAAGNKTTSATIGVTVSNSAPPASNPAGLIAAYGFNEGNGTTVADASGSGNTGIISGASWTTQGKYGNALSFNGVNNWVTINDAPSLGLTTALTLEAWVFPTAQPTGWTTVVLKEQSGALVYALYAGSPNGPPGAYIFTTTEQGANGSSPLPLNAWSHLAATYDGTTIRVYVNGSQVTSQTASGTIVNSTAPMHVGGNSVWGEYLTGQIDEVRIYNRALSASEIQTDMNTPVGTTTPSIAATFTWQAVRIGVFRPSTGQWYLDVNGNGLLDDCQIGGCPAPFGQQGNLPVVGDWTGTGTAEIGVFDPTALQWQLDGNGNDLWEGCTVDLCLNFGRESDNLPVAGRWTSTATQDLIGIYRPSRNSWQLDLNGDGLVDTCTVDDCPSFGSLSGLPVVGDWTGTGTTKLGIFNPGSNPAQQWKLDLNGNGNWDGCAVDACRGPFGLSGDRPVAGDWTGTGQVRIGVFNPSSGLWDLDLNGNGVFDGCAVDACLGPFVPPQQGDLPVVGKW